MASHKISYQYDAVGNRTRMTDHLSGEVTTYTYDVRNQLQTMVDSSGTTTFTYDMNGNRIRKETPADMIDYTWDGQQRLIKVETANDEINFTYNPDGQRVKKESNAGITSYLYDFNHLLQEMDGDDQTEKLYTFTDDQWGDLISEYSEENGSLHHQYDAQWSTQALLDEDQSVTDRYKYGAFGLQDHAAGTSKNPHTFVGKQGYYRDSELDLYMLGMGNGDGLGGRFYDPELGRFISEDPRRHEGGDENLYRYVNNNPINQIDSSGQSFPVAVPFGPFLEIGDGETNEEDEFADVTGETRLTWDDLTLPARYVLSTITSPERFRIASRQGVPISTWMTMIEREQQKRTKEQADIVNQLKPNLEKATQKANEYLRLYRDLDLQSVSENELFWLGIAREAFPGPNCTWIVRVPVVFTWAGKGLTEQQLDTRFAGDPRVWVVLEKYLETTYSYSSVDWSDVPVKPQFGSGALPSRVRTIENQEWRWRARPLFKGKARDPYYLWTNVYEDKEQNVEKIKKDLLTAGKSQGEVTRWRNAAGALEFALHLLPFGGAVDTVVSGNEWTTEDTLYLVLDTALLFTGVGSVMKSAGKAATTAVKGTSGTSRMLTWGTRIQKTAAAVNVASGGYQSALLAKDVQNAQTDAERMKALGIMLVGLFLLAGDVKAVAKAKRNKLLGTGEKGAAKGTLEVSAEKGVKANTVSPKQRKLRPSDISCLKKCFPAGTLVESEYGLRPIEQVSEKDRVWGRSEVIGRWSLANVVECYERVHQGEVVTLTLSSGEQIQATGSHPFWVVEGEDLDERPAVGELAPPERSSLEGRWVECRDVRPGDQLASLHGEAVQVTSTASRLAQITVHNLQIAELATYTVGAAAVWVHNASKILCPKGTSKAPDFEGTLRGVKQTLPGVKTKPITYKKLDASAARTARNRFNSTDRPAFLQGLADDPAKVAQLKKAGLTDADIAKMKDGLVPSGYQVHHKIPIDAGGSNSPSNLILMKNEPYHKTITNYQNSLIRGMTPGDVKSFDYPIPEGFIYPP